MKLVLFTNRIELQIMMFEDDTAFTVSAITLGRSADGSPEVKVEASPR